MSKSGPTNFTVSRLKRPPNPTHKGEPQVQVCVVTEVLGKDKHGYERLSCRDRKRENAEDFEVIIGNPDHDIVYWFSQSSHHSTIIYKGQYFALMGVTQRNRPYRKKWNPNKPASSALVRPKGKPQTTVLHIHPIELPEATTKWIDKHVDEQVSTLLFGMK